MSQFNHLYVSEEENQGPCSSQGLEPQETLERPATSDEETRRRNCESSEELAHTEKPETEKDFLSCFFPFMA